MCRSGVAMRTNVIIENKSHVNRRDHFQKGSHVDRHVMSVESFLSCDKSSCSLVRYRNVLIPSTSPSQDTKLALSCIQHRTSVDHKPMNSNFLVLAHRKWVKHLFSDDATLNVLAWFSWWHLICMILILLKTKILLLKN